MASNPNRIFQFFQELKRRKVIRVITVYAAAAFVIMELVDIVAPNLGLPSWTFNLVMILLLVGFVITVIVSWIYDIHPEGGIIKTKPVHKAKPEDIPKSSNSWKIASYVSFLVIVGLIVLNVIPRIKSSATSEILNKSIAVLPFRNDSPDEEKMYFINGTMEAIFDNLCKIKDLRVVSRNSVEQYRNNPKPTTVVAEEMDVSYVLEGSGQKLGNRLILTVQLILGKDDSHLWSRQYDRVIEEVEDMFDIQKEIAEMVAEEIKAIITPEEKKLIEKVPTTSLSALDFYQRGRDEFAKHWWIDRDNRTALESAENFYHLALEYDSAFAQAYTGLAWVYWSKHYWQEIFSEDFLDSVLILCDRALSYENQVADVYIIRGDYYREKGVPDEAITEYDKALRINPNSWEAYYGKGALYFQIDLLKTIDNYQKAALLNRGSELPELFKTIGYVYLIAGFPEKSDSYYLEALKLDGDSASYYSWVAVSEQALGNYNKAIESGEKAFVIDSTNTGTLFELGSSYSFCGRDEESLKYFKKLVAQFKATPEASRKFANHQRIGYAFWQNDNREQAEHYFNVQMEHCQSSIKVGNRYSQLLYAYYDIAAIHALRGEKDKAFENLKIFNQRQMMPYWMVTLIKNDPLFENIRDEPEFQQIVRDVEAKYETEHERVRQWLKENDLL
jgi:TolB-like protein/Tfp pilus assembly protein PilF